MHVLQYIAVKSDTVENAFDSVKNNLESYLNDGGSWYDWFVTGGGRWASSEEAQYDDDFMGDVISYANTPDLFNEKITQAMESRIREFNDYRKDVEKIDITIELDKYNGFTDYSFSLYPLKKMIDMLQGDWDFNSYFYDATNYSANPKHMLDKIASNETDWFLVPVDFHF